MSFGDCMKVVSFFTTSLLNEDWAEDNITGIRPHEIEPMTVIGLIGSIIYQLTEIYEFLSKHSPLRAFMMEGFGSQSRS